MTNETGKKWDEDVQGTTAVNSEVVLLGTLGRTCGATPALLLTQPLLAPRTHDFTPHLQS